MIARTWHGRVPAAKADAYQSYLYRTGVPDYESTPGNRGVLVLRRTEGDETHFVLTTLWDSVEAIRRFAGDDYLRARYYPEDDEYLLEREPFVTHYEVLQEPPARVLDALNGRPLSDGECARRGRDDADGDPAHAMARLRDERP